MNLWNSLSLEKKFLAKLYPHFIRLKPSADGVLIATTSDVHPALAEFVGTWRQFDRVGVFDEYIVKVSTRYVFKLNVNEQA
jgi:hypothetical protein